jgi:ABC-2 type transport system ATP-binding protein
MDDIEALCSRVILINHGRILSDGTLADLRSQVTTERRLIIDLADPDGKITDPHATEIRREGGRVHLRFHPDEVSTAELIGRITACHPVLDLFVENPPIEEIIAQAYGGTVR